jgi:bifunctional DNA primase/polymerase-like protein
MSSAALAYALGLRLHVFPCLETKAPTCPNGFKAATREPDAIRELWRRWPGPLIGVPTGAMSGFDVLDIDRDKGGGVWYAAHRGKLPPTRYHRTRSGGLHLLFRHTEGLRNSTSRIAPGIDTRGDGGYVIFWPAAGLEVGDHPLNALPEWPLWLLPSLMSPPVPPGADLSEGVETPGGDPPRD